MKKMLFVLLLMAGLAGAGYWFWSLGVIQTMKPRVITLSVQQSGVQVKKPGSNEWQVATSGMHIEHGWMIKTDESGLASVRFYDQGETRLDRNSEMVISDASLDDQGYARLKATVTLNTGRIWSRVLRLLDIDSSYSIRTSEVVATVRGTAFGVQKNVDGTVAVDVSQSAVSIASTANPNQLIKAIGEGSSVSFNAKGSVTNEHVITNEERSNGWFVSNEMADQSFVSEELQKRVNELKLLGGVRPDNPLNSIVALSERVHLALASDTTKNVLLEQYLSRRLYHLIELVQSGKTGLAAQELTRIENDLQAQIEAKKNGAETDYIRSAVYRISLLLDDTNPSDALYPFKQRVERLFETLSSSSDLSKLYARLITFDARLDEATRLIDIKSFDDARVTLDGVKSGIENVRRDSTILLPTLTDEYRAAFEGKLSALEVRQQLLRTRLDAAAHPMAPLNASSTEMMLGTTGSSTSTPVINLDDVVSISVTASPNTLDIGQRAKLIVKGNKPDGTQVDLTPFAVFSSMQYVGKLNGPSYTATGIGKDEIIARYASKSGMLESKVMMTAKGEVKLMDLVITSNKGLDLVFGQKTELTATARYNNGVTKNVTNQTTFVIVSGGGSVQNGVFSSNGPLSGQTAIAGTFKDANITSIASIKINVGK